MDDLTTERSFGSKETRAIDVLGLYFDILFMGVCTTRHLQTSGRLVQDLDSVLYATSITISHRRVVPEAESSNALQPTSHCLLELGGGFRRVLRFPPLLTTG